MTGSKPWVELDEDLRKILRALRLSGEILMSYPTNMKIGMTEWTRWYHAMEEAEEARSRLVRKGLENG